MKFIYKLLFACVSGAINLMYQIQNGRAFTYFDSVAKMYFKCTPCADTTNKETCRHIDPGTIYDIEYEIPFSAVSGTADPCKFYLPGGYGGFVTPNGYVDVPAHDCDYEEQICDAGKFYNPADGLCYDGCPDGGTSHVNILPSALIGTFLRERFALGTSAFYYAGWACNYGPDGTEFGGWYDCVTTNGNEEAFTFAVGECRREISGFLVNSLYCGTTQFADDAGGGTYTPSCGYTWY